MGTWKNRPKPVVIKVFLLDPQPNLLGSTTRDTETSTRSPTFSSLPPDTEACPRLSKQRKNVVFGSPRATWFGLKTCWTSVLLVYNKEKLTSAPSWWFYNTFPKILVNRGNLSQRACQKRLPQPAIRISCYTVVSKQGTWGRLEKMIYSNVSINSSSLEPVLCRYPVASTPSNDPLQDIHLKLFTHNCLSLLPSGCYLAKPLLVISFSNDFWAKKEFLHL